VVSKHVIPDLVRGLAEQYEVVGPVAKGDALRADDRRSSHRGVHPARRGTGPFLRSMPELCRPL